MESSSVTAALSSGDDSAAVPSQLDGTDERAVSEPAKPASPSSSTAIPATVRRPSAAAASKVVYFVRHAESAYNAFKLSPVNWLTLRALKDPMLFDPPLSPAGLSQLASLSATASKWRLTQRAQLLVVSPLKRAIDTALAVMGQPLLAGPQQKEAAAAGVGSYPLPVFVSALCTEIVDTSADIGSSPAVLSAAYPLLSFSHLPEAWWYHADPLQPRAITDEPRDRVAHRVSSFLQWLCRRDETVIVVVSHSAFIRHCTGARLKIANCQLQECSVAQQPDGRITVTVTREALH